MKLARFSVRNPVPVNLLMMAIILAGLAAGQTLQREFFPRSDPDRANVTLPYPGATPQEVEEGLAIKVEDKLSDLDELDEMVTTLSEGGGGITVVFRERVDPDKATDEVERSIDSLTDLPEEAERITVSLQEIRLPVIRVTVYGDVDEAVLKRAIRGIRDDLLSLSGMGEVLVSGVRDYEVRVDVDAEATLKLGLSLPAIADQIRAEMREVPGGTVRTRAGNVKVRTMGVAERAQAIREIVVRAEPDGRVVRLDDIAEVREGFVDSQLTTRFNGEPAATLTVFKVGDQDIVKIAEMTRAYVAGRNGEPLELRGLAKLTDGHRQRAWELGVNSSQPLPVGAKIATNSDLARFVEGRLDLLVRNATYGAMLVFATLLLVLNWRVAFWVGVGLTTAIMGTLVLMAWLEVTLNLLTMFGLIVVLGLLVDDAIVVSENIQTCHDRGEPALEAAVTGTRQVFWPVVATVLTSVVAFLPLTWIEGRIGDLLGALPLVVACALLMSLIETILILPSHMGHSLKHRDRSTPGRAARFVRRFEEARDGLLLRRVVPWYGRCVEFLLRFRYSTVAVAMAVLIASAGMVVGGRVPFVFLPESDSETIIVNVRMPIGTPIERTEAVVSRIEAAAQAQPEVLSIASVVGERANLETLATEASAPHVAQMYVELNPVEQRDRQSSEVTDSIRTALRGQIDEVERITYEEITGGPSGPDISIRVRGRDMQRIEQAVTRIKDQLGEFEGLFDIADDNDLGQLELQIRLRPGARAIGFTTEQVARQVRGFLFGIDAHVFAERQEDIDVRVRVDEATRQSLYAIENAWLVSPAGAIVPLAEVADITETTTYATIRRVDRQRAVTVTAETATWLSPEAVTAELDLDEVRRAFPTLTIEYAGRQEQNAEAFASLPYGFLAAILMIYVILAWLFGSYVQPLIVLLAVPFATVGVIWGHWVLGFDLTFLSLIGFVALSGIVVNDSLILVKFFNERIAEGGSVADNLAEAGRARFRAILLTTVTTVLGLTPLILEQSFQARFLIPMAIAIAGGLLSATVLILCILPCMILIFEDLKAAAHYLWHGEPRPESTLEPVP